MGRTHETPPAAAEFHLNEGGGGVEDVLDVSTEANRRIALRRAEAAEAAAAASCFPAPPAPGSVLVRVCFIGWKLEECRRAKKIVGRVVARRFGAAGFLEDDSSRGGGLGRCGRGDECLDELVARFNEEWKAVDLVRSGPTDEEILRVEFNRLGPILGVVSGPLWGPIFGPFLGMPFNREFCSIVLIKEYRLQHQEGQSREIMGTGQGI